jgi:soluble lytic murein transglycosylase-like protein
MRRVKKEQENKGDAPSDSRRRCRRVILRSLPCLTALFALLLLVNANESAKRTGPDWAREAFAEVSVNYAKLDKETFYNARCGGILSVNSTDAGFLLPAATPEARQAGAILSVYNARVPLDRELQQYLYDLCRQRNLDYKMALAVIQHESNFNPEALGGGANYGLFQINSCHHGPLSAALNTDNAPFDPKTNINWGTYLLSRLYEKYSGRYQGEELTRAVLSAYNKGTGGFEKYGHAIRYLEDHERALAKVNSWFE